MKNKVKSYNRRYLHFDTKKNYLDWMEKVEDDEWVKSHGFYPFIHFKVKATKYIWCEKEQKKKKENKERSIKYAAHIDRFIYKHYSEGLNRFYNDYLDGRGLHEVSTAYRSNLEGKSNIHFAKDVFEFLATQNDAYVYLGDFKKFFDRLDHRYLKSMIMRVLNKQALSDGEYAVYKNITKYSWINLKDIGSELGVNPKKVNKIKSKQLFLPKQFRDMKLKKLKKNPNNFGIPQGSPISAVYSNVYMIEFDELMRRYVQSFNGLYKRYSDDFIAVFPTESVDESGQHRMFINNLVNSIPKLKLAKEKVEEYIWNNSDNNKLKSINDSNPATMNYLGFSFDGNVVKIRDKSLFKFYARAYKKVSIVNKYKGEINWRKHKRDLLRRYTFQGDIPYGKYKNSNFLTYARRSQKIFDNSEVLKNEIANQVKNHWKYINKRIK